LAQDFGDKEKKFMKKRKTRAEEPIGKGKIIDDFLSKPKDLILKEEMTKITISLTKSSVNFFKNQSTKYHTNY
jgi:hypothetical protein